MEFLIFGFYFVLFQIVIVYFSYVFVDSLKKHDYKIIGLTLTCVFAAEILLGVVVVAEFYNFLVEQGFINKQ